MPKTVKVPADAGFKDSLTLPRDGEAIDAADVNSPMLDLLGNDNWLYRTVAAQAQRIEELERLRGGFVLAVPPTLSVEPARTYTLTSGVGVGRLDGYSSPVALTILGLPVGVTATFNPTPATGNSSDLTVVVDEATVGGTYDVTVRGVGGDGKINDALLKLTVAESTLAASFDFYNTGARAMTFEQASGTVNRTLDLPLRREGGFAAPITFSISGLPAGMTGNFSPNPMTGSAPEDFPGCTLTLTTTGTGIPAGTYSPIIRASGGNVVRTLPLALTVTVPAGVGQPDYSVAITYDTASGLTGNGATITITRSSGMTAPVTLGFNPDPYGPVLLVNGQPWSATVSSNTARITADGSSRGLTNSGVAPAAGLPPQQLGLTTLTAVATVNGVRIERGVQVTYRSGTRSY